MAKKSDQFAIHDKVLKLLFYEISWELASASDKFGAFNSLHEGIAVIREEYLELEKEVFDKNSCRTLRRKEAIQLAAMTVRFLKDFCGNWEEEMEF